jgi:hypothetical protein
MCYQVGQKSTHVRQCGNANSLQSKQHKSELHRRSAFLRFVTQQYTYTQETGWRSWLRARRLRSRSSSPGMIKNFLLSSSRPALGSTQPPIQWVPGAFCPGIRRPGREADHSPPASTKDKKMWIYTSTPPYVFKAKCLIRLGSGWTTVGSELESR